MNNVKLFLSDKISAKDWIHLIENNNLVKTILKTAEVSHNLFSKIIPILDIPRYSNDASNGQFT